MTVGGVDCWLLADGDLWLSLSGVCSLDGEFLAVGGEFSASENPES